MNEFISFLNSLFGTYTPVVDGSGVIPSGMAGVDFPYIFRALLFVIVVYSVFKLLGGIITKTY